MGAPTKLCDSILRTQSSLPRSMRIAFGVRAMHKSEQWSHEREWRLLCVESAAPEGRAVRMPIPKALHWGCRMAEIYRAQILEVASATGVPCYEAALAGTTFALEPRRISQ